MVLRAAQKESVMAFPVTPKAQGLLAVYVNGMTRGRTRNRAVRVGNNSAVLDVEPSNRGDRRTNKLSDDGDLLVGIDSQARTIERRGSHAV
jgi:hypothetical protein